MYHREGEKFNREQIEVKKTKLDQKLRNETKIEYNKVKNISITEEEDVILLPKDNVKADNIYKDENEHILPLRNKDTILETQPDTLEKQEEDEIFLVKEILHRESEKTEENNKTQERHDFIKRNNIWSLGETVLTRYYCRGKWKYYVGVITEIVRDENCYKISYYKTTFQKGYKFTKPKRADVDIVHDDVIVKAIQLLQITENPDTYVLMEDEDSVYF